MLMDWKLIIVKMSILPKMIYRFNVITIKILAGFFHRYRKADPNIYRERQRSYNNQNDFESEESHYLRLT